MIKERIQLIRTSIFIVELLLITVAYFGVYLIFLHFPELYEWDFLEQWDVLKPPASLEYYSRAYWLALLVWAVILRVRGGYEHLRIQTYPRVIMNNLLNSLLFFGFFSSGAFILRFQFLSRAFVVSYIIASTVLCLSFRLGVLLVAHQVRRKGFNYRNLVLVGTGRRAQQFMSIIAQHREWGLRIIGLLDKESDKIGKTIAGYPVIGVLDDLPKLLEKYVVDEIFFVVPRGWIPDIEKCILYCEAVGVPASLATDFFDLEIAKGVPREISGLTYLTFETRLLKESELLVKRCMDVACSLGLLALSAPVFALVSLMIKMTSKGPVFFRQIRSGRNGRKFVLYKFRSMVPDAEARLEALKHRNEMSGPVFKIENDPRVTSWGRFLRKTSLDEIPQFWNVLKGDMSLVGPRPPLPSEVEKYEPWQRRRLSMKPGITCIWQVSGRNEIDFDDWMRLDLQYIDRWSIWLDIKLIFLTIKAVLSRRGAK